jgi:hypothetical protein
MHVLQTERTAMKQILRHLLRVPHPAEELASLRSRLEGHLRDLAPFKQGVQDE